MNTSPLLSASQEPRTKNEEGFTLIEILVAATIIALLATLGMVGYQAAGKNGRDVKRKSDLEQLRSALEIFKADDVNGYYPAASGCVASGLEPSYVNPYPPDPQSLSYRYCYVRGATNKTYALCAHLENGSGADNSSSCGGVNNCSSPAGANCNYVVSNP